MPPPTDADKANLGTQRTEMLRILNETITAAKSEKRKAQDRQDPLAAAECDTIVANAETLRRKLGESLLAELGDSAAVKGAIQLLKDKRTDLNSAVDDGLASAARRKKIAGIIGKLSKGVETLKKVLPESG